MKEQIEENAYEIKFHGCHRKLEKMPQISIGTLFLAANNPRRNPTVERKILSPLNVQKSVIIGT